jgi:CRP/FNR family transcriptional regulator, cyclic AMP receptor protein
MTRRTDLTVAGRTPIRLRHSPVHPEVGRRPVTASRRRRTYPLLDVDPGLGRLVHEDRREAADRELRVELYRLPQGEWSSDYGAAAGASHIGLLLVEGVVSREVVVADCVSTELLGPGDILRPWTIHDDDRLLRHGVRWNALTACRVAVLDRRFAAQLGEWPEVNAALGQRLSERAQRLAATQAISQLTRVERRLMALFWHLAERWGRVTAQGVVLPLTLSHRMLGQLVGARRPTVSTAIAALVKQDRIVRRGNGTWLLKGDPAGVAEGAVLRVLEGRQAELLVGELPTLPVTGTPEASVLAATHADELRAALERLHDEIGERTDAMRGITGRTQELLDRLAQLRRSVRDDRDERSIAGGGLMTGEAGL